MSVKRMQVTPFVMVEAGKRKKGKRIGPRPRREIRASSMLIKLGICASACLAALIVKVATSDVAPANAQAQHEQSADLTQLLGRLEFVSLADVASVFSQSTHPILPVQGEALAMDDGSALRWRFSETTAVAAAMNGTVRAIGTDDVYGTYVQLSHANDVQTYYYGLDSVFVEQGQPVLTQDTLGEVEAGGTLKFFVLKDGRPQDPSQYFND